MKFTFSPDDERFRQEVRAFTSEHLPADVARRNRLWGAGELRFFSDYQLWQGRLAKIMGASGHIAGVVNPPTAKERSHWVDGKVGGTAEQWLASANEAPGSWWTDWAAWLKPHAGKLVPASKSYGSRKHKVIEPGPLRQCQGLTLIPKENTQ